MELTKGQKKLAERKYDGASVIKGDLHTGKTGIGLARMYYLTHECQDQLNNVLYVTQRVVDEVLISKRYEMIEEGKNLSLFDDEMNKVEADIVSLEGMMTSYFRTFSVHKKMKIVGEVPNQLLLELIAQSKKVYPRVKWLNEAHIDFIKQEVEMINACGYLSFEAYQNADRKGAMIKLPKRGAGRKAIWLISEEVAKALKAQHHILYSRMQLEVVELIKAQSHLKQYHHLIVDDTEQYTKVELEFIKALSNENGDILFLMNKGTKVSYTAWLGLGRHFKTIGYNMTGKTSTLKKSTSTRTRKKVAKKITELVNALTPLEEFMLHFIPSQKVDYKKENAKKDTTKKETIKVEDIDFANQMTLDEMISPKKSVLPWYVDTYKYVNKATGVETIFQSDSSAGEIYIEDELQNPDGIVALPLYSSDIAAGTPIEIVEEISGNFYLPGDLLHYKKDTYVLHVQGDSMIGAAIDDGDYVVIQAGNVNNNEIAAVYYNGATTLKRIVQQGEHVMLVSENPKYGPIIIDDGEFRVMGKLIGVIKPV